MSAPSNVIQLPNNWKPRDYQLPVWQYLMRGGKRVNLIWPRRHGKDDLALHWTACASQQRVGTYWHCLPESAQSRKAIWDAVNESTGRRRIDEAFPDSICETKRNQDMFIRFKNGSTWALVGSDNYDSLVGTPPVGIVFSEFALANPAAWGYLRPILANNNGWAMFVSTPRGRNHLYTLYNHAKESPEWFAELLTVDDTQLMPPERMTQELEEYIATFGREEGTALFKQEYYCSFEGAVSGSYYASFIDQAEADNRITSVPHDPALPVTTAWDLGVGDATGIWFLQKHQMEIRAIDYLEASGEGLAYYVKELQAKPYNYENHIMPHDIRVRELGTGKSRYEMAQNLGIKPITIAKSIPIDDGINAVRTLLPRMWFDKNKCKIGLEALRAYRKEYDDVRKCYKNKPLHDGASHANDALRYYAVAGDVLKPKAKSAEEAMRGMDFHGIW